MALPKPSAQTAILILVFFSYLSYYTTAESIEVILNQKFNVSLSLSRTAYIIGFLGRYVLPNFIAGSLADSFFGQILVLKYAVWLTLFGCLLSFVGVVADVATCVTLGYTVGICGWGCVMPLCLCIYLNQRSSSSSNNDERCSQRFYWFYFYITGAHVIAGCIILPTLSVQFGVLALESTGQAIGISVASFISMLLAGATLVGSLMNYDLIDKKPAYKEKVDILSSIFLIICSSLFRYCCCCLCLCGTKKIEPQKDDLSVVEMVVGQENRALDEPESGDSNPDAEQAKDDEEAETQEKEQDPVSVIFASVGHKYPKALLQDATSFSSLFWLFWSIAFYYAGYIDSLKRWYTMLAMTDVYVSNTAFFPPAYVRSYLTFLVFILTPVVMYFFQCLGTKPSRRVLIGLLMGAASLFLSGYVQTIIDDNGKTRLNTVSIHMTLGVMNGKSEAICGWFSNDREGLVEFERLYGNRTLPGSFEEPFVLEPLMSTESYNMSDIEIHRNETYFHYRSFDDCYDTSKESQAIRMDSDFYQSDFESDRYSNYRLMVSDGPSSEYCKYRAIGERTTTGYAQVQVIPANFDQGEVSIVNLRDPIRESTIIKAESCSSENEQTLKKPDREDFVPDLTEDSYTIQETNVFYVAPDAENPQQLEINGKLVEFYARYGGTYVIYLPDSNMNGEILVESVINENTVSVFILLPQLLLLALSDVIIVTSSFEYAYIACRKSVQTLCMNVVIGMLSFGNIIRLFVSLEPEIFGHFYVSDFAWYVTWGGCMCISIAKFLVFSIRSDL